MEEKVRAAIINELRRLVGDAADLQVRVEGVTFTVQGSIDIDCLAMAVVSSRAGDP